MYRRRPNLQIGFHGCDELVRNDLVSKPDIVKKSQESYDWLGHGFYVWENNYQRALQWAQDKEKRGTLTTPSVVGVIYLLDYCLDLTDSEFIGLLEPYYNSMKKDLRIAGKELPKNKDIPMDKYHDLIKRELDCAVIEYMHQKIEEEIKSDVANNGFSDYRHFDSVRGPRGTPAPVTTQDQALSARSCRGNSASVLSSSVTRLVS